MSRRFRLLAKRQVLLPTIWGWLLLLLVLAGSSVLGVICTYPFLAYDKPIDADVFIIEGWVPDYVLDRSLAPSKEGRCRLLITTGGPLEIGAELTSYKTEAELTAARFMKMGFRKEQIVAVPSPAVDRNRTHAAALAVKKWLETNPAVRRANLVTGGAHARRSFMIFRAVLPTTFELGVYAVPPRDYDPQRWWATSEGFRTVLSEGIAYTYALLAGPR